MYRIFCESYENFLNTFEDENYRLNIAKPFELIVDTEKFEEEKKVQSDLYKKLCDLLTYMKNNIMRFPKFKAFLWTFGYRKNYSLVYSGCGCDYQCFNKTPCKSKCLSSKPF